MWPSAQSVPFGNSQGVPEITRGTLAVDSPLWGGSPGSPVCDSAQEPPHVRPHRIDFTWDQSCLAYLAKPCGEIIYFLIYFISKGMHRTFKKNVMSRFIKTCRLLWKPPKNSIHNHMGMSCKLGNPEWSEIRVCWFLSSNIRLWQHNCPRNRWNALWDCHGHSQSISIKMFLMCHSPLCLSTMYKHMQTHNHTLTFSPLT